LNPYNQYNIIVIKVSNESPGKWVNRERQEAGMKKLFNDKWSFCKFPLDTPVENIFQSEDWKPVDVPHDWMIYNTENLYEEAISCYKKTFQEKNLPEPPRIRSGWYLKGFIWILPYFSTKNGFLPGKTDTPNLL
jgi:hypothetical protein